MSDYPRLTIEDFGEQLLTTGDLDPIYIALHKMQMPHEQLCRWLIAYWCWYSAGVACHMSELDGRVFWQEMRVAAENVAVAPHGRRWERAKERRHARGQQGLDMVNDLQQRYFRPAALVDYLCEPEYDTSENDDGLCELVPKPLIYADVARKVQSHTLFGPWIAYKICDMIERLGLAPIHFTVEDAMYEEPRKAALMVFDELVRNNTLDKQPRFLDADTEVIPYVVDRLLNHFSQYTAPPRHERPVGMQEIETILCCYKSHCKGSYPLFNDIDEIHEGLVGWIPICKTARKFHESLPTR